MSKYLFSFLSFLFILNFHAQANTLYLVDDNGCMDKLEYIYTHNGEQTPYILLRLSPDVATSIFFNINNQETTLLQKLPSKTIDCSQAAKNFDIETIRQINTGETNIYITTPHQDGYKVTKVTSGAFSQIENDEATFINNEFDFTAKLSVKAEEQVISSNQSPQIIRLNNLTQLDCSHSLQLTSYKSENGVNYTNFLQYIPRLGITTYNSQHGKDQPYNKFEFELVYVNGKEFINDLADFCIKTTGNSSYVIDTTPTSSQKIVSTKTTTDVIPEGAIYTGHIGFDKPKENIQIQVKVDQSMMKDGSQVEKIEEFVSLSPKIVKPYKPIQVGNENFAPRSIPENFEKIERTNLYVNPSPLTVPNNTSCGQSVDGHHYVGDGQTLFSIAKVYGLSVSELKALNNLNTNIIKPCTLLKVVAIEENETAVIKKELKVKSIPLKSEKISAQEGEFTEKGSVPNSYTAITVLDDLSYHLVQKGETLSSLARRFGYTTEKLATMNNIAVDGTLFVGRRLCVNECECGHKTSYIPEEYKPKFAERLDVNDDVSIEFYSEATVMSKGEFTDKSASASQPDKIYTKVSNNSVFTPGRSLMHEVQEGESMRSIADKYETTVKYIRENNGLTEDDILFQGQRIFVR